jgi:1-acyl-sn-glycerol-3-phosphate acyltransferase
LEPPGGLRALLHLLRLALVGVYTVVLGVPAIVLGLGDRSGQVVVRIGRIWVRWILATFGVTVQAEGLENIPSHAPVIFMSNHQSLFDIPAIVHTLPVGWRFVAKKELVRVPVFGWALVTTGQIIIDRGNRVRAVRSLRKAAERIRAGSNVIVFPEGTRSPTGMLRQFKSGPFHLAVEAQVPVIPVTVSGSQRVTRKGSLEVHPGVVKIRYGKPIPTRGLTPEDRNDLKTRVRDAIIQGYDPGFQGVVLVEPDPAPATRA